MCAGVASSPSITRSRSSPSSGGERSTIRYWIGFVSGTPRLRHERLDHLERLAIPPIAFADDRVAHAPPRIDHEGHRKAIHTPRARRDRVLGVEPHGKVQLRA